MNNFVAVLKKWKDFKGRATRSEFWMFVLINWVISAVLLVIDMAVFGMESGGPGYLQFVYGLAIIVPATALNFRRLHDIGKSGWWLFIIFVPFVGPILLIIFWIRDSQAGPNIYGPNPKGIGNEPEVAEQPPAT